MKCLNVCIPSGCFCLCTISNQMEFKTTQQLGATDFHRANVHYEQKQTRIHSNALAHKPWSNWEIYLSDECTVGIKDREQIRWEHGNLECNRKCDCTKNAMAREQQKKKEFIHFVPLKDNTLRRVSESGHSAYQIQV